jgi:hypothetical protein
MKTYFDIFTIVYSIKSKKHDDYTYENAYNDTERIIKILKKRRNKNAQNILKPADKINTLDTITSIEKSHFPKILHLTCKDKHKIDNPIWINCLEKYKHMYKCKFKIHDNNDIYKFFESFDNDNLHYIKEIKIGAVLADIFRYAILYVKGGIYSDMDCEPLQPIENLFKNNHYHGRSDNFFYIYPNHIKLENSECDFYENPCNNCSYVSQNNGIIKYVCLGHRYITHNTDIVVCYEFDKTWCKNRVDDLNNKHKWLDKDIGVCQWYIIAKPNQQLFLDCYRECINNIKHLLTLDKNNDYHFNVINGSGPLCFTKIINKKIENGSLSKKNICFLPSDFFCCGSNESVPQTKNSYVKHNFTGTWLK